MFIRKTFNMTLARLYATFFLLVYLEIACGKEQELSSLGTGLCLNNNVAGGAQQVLQRRAALLSESQNCNQNIKGNVGITVAQQLQHNQAGLLQGNSQGNFQANNQLGNYQQQSNLQQAINTQLPLNWQQPASNQNQQICLNQNFQPLQSQNIQQVIATQNPQKQCFPNQNQHIPVNPTYQQSQNLQQNVNLQPQVVQRQQTSTIFNNNQQMLGQPTLPQSDISLASNMNRQRLPTQVSQGTLLSHLGIQSNLPTLLPNLYGAKQTAGQASFNQNNCPNNAQPEVTTIINRAQTCVSPSSVASQQFQLMQNPQQNIIPAQNQFNQYIPNIQQQFVPAQNQAVIGLSQSIPSSVQGQSTKTSLQSQPVQGLAMATSVPCHSTPQAQNQLTYSPVPIQNNPIIQTHSSLVPVSQYSQSPNNWIPQYPSNLPGSQDNGINSKSSNIKQLLPLLFNLLKAKNCCACSQNPNCGCMCKNNPTFGNQSPQVVGGYSRYVKNVPAVVNTAANIINSDEEDDNDTVWRLKKYKNYNETKVRHNGSPEEEDDEDSAEDGKDSEE